MVNINDFVSTNQQSKVSSFADDAKISRAIKFNTDLALLQDDLKNFVKQFIENNMDLHEDLKFEISIYNIYSAYSLKKLTFSYDFLTYETSKGRDISEGPSD